MSNRRIESPNDSERRWIKTEIANARKLVELLSPADNGTPLTPQVLDRAYKAARRSAGNDAQAANVIINAVGMAFGQFLVEQHGFQWVAVFENGSAEIGVLALPGRGDVLVFPPNLVGKRWAAGTTDFLSPIYTGICENLVRVQSQWAGEFSKIPEEIKPWYRKLFRR